MAIMNSLATLILESFICKKKKKKAAVEATCAATGTTLPFPVEINYGIIYNVTSSLPISYRTYRMKVKYINK